MPRAPSTTALTLLAALALGAPLALGQVAPAAPPPPPPAPIVATVVGLRNDTGFVDMGLYAQTNWLRDAGRLVRCKTRIARRQAVCTLVPPRAGTYAIAFAHDENDNGRVDQGLFGIPLEGYGFSNDAHPVLSAPAFTACRFAYAGGPLALRMTAQY